VLQGSSHPRHFEKNESKYVKSFHINFLKDYVLNNFKFTCLQHTKRCGKQTGSAQMLHIESAQVGQMAREQWQLGSLQLRDGVKEYFIC
jgi:hypothetical protein